MTTPAAANAEPSIRPIRTEDLDAVIRIYRQSAVWHQSLDPERYYVPAEDAVSERFRTRMRQAAAADRSDTLIADVDGNVAGFMDVQIENSTDLMHRDRGFCHIVELAVDDQYRSQGIATRLLHGAESWGRERGAHFALLEFHPANTRAGALYEQRLGYVRTSHMAIKTL